MNQISGIPTVLLKIPANTGTTYTLLPANKVDKVIVAPDKKQITFNVDGNPLYLNPKDFNKAVTGVTNALGNVLDCDA